MMMLKRREDLVAAALEQAEGIDKAQARFNRQLRTLYRNYIARAEALLADPRNFSATDTLSLANANRIAEQLKGILSDSGADDILADFADEFEKTNARTLKYFRQLGAGATLAGVDRDALKTWVRFSERTLADNFDAKLVKPLQETIFQSVYGGQSSDQIITAVMTRADSLSFGQAETIVQDALAQYSRSVTADKAESLGLEIFVYEGPDDSITSEQCNHLLNIDEHGMPGALYKDEISADLHPNLRGNPLITGGHPRCRHRYLPITLEFAKDQGFKE